MNKQIKKRKNVILPSLTLLLLMLIVVFFTTCKKEEAQVNCRDIVKAHPGYEVWAGDSAFFTIANNPDYFYNIDKCGYIKIGEATTTQTFNTGTYKYYVIVAKYYACIDAIQFFDSSYYDFNQGYSLITGLCEYDKFRGAPDGITGKFGSLEGCPPPLGAGDNSFIPGGLSSSAFNAYVTDDATITSRGGGLKVIIVSGCQ